MVSSDNVDDSIFAQTEENVKESSIIERMYQPLLDARLLEFLISLDITAICSANDIPVSLGKDSEVSSSFLLSSFMTSKLWYVLMIVSTNSLGL